MTISRIILTTAAAFSIVGLSGAAFAQTYQQQQGQTDQGQNQGQTTQGQGYQGQNTQGYQGQTTQGQGYQGQSETERERADRMNRESSSSTMPRAGDTTQQMRNQRLARADRN